MKKDSIAVNGILAAVALFITLMVLIAMCSGYEPKSSLIEDIGRRTREIQKEFQKGYNDSTRHE